MMSYSPTSLYKQFGLTNSTVGNWYTTPTNYYIPIPVSCTIADNSTLIANTISYQAFSLAQWEQWYLSDARWNDETVEQRMGRETAEVERTAKYKVAAKRGEDLLVSLLNPKQRETYVSSKCFDIFVQGKHYRLWEGQRVQELDIIGRPVVAYCIHPEFKYGLPPADVLVAQKLMLETDPAGFFKMANATRLVESSPAMQEIELAA